QSGFLFFLLVVTERAVRLFYSTSGKEQAMGNGKGCGSITSRALASAIAGVACMATRALAQFPYCDVNRDNVCSVADYPRIVAYLGTAGAAPNHYEDTNLDGQVTGDDFGT